MLLLGNPYSNVPNAFEMIFWVMKGFWFLMRRSAAHMDSRLFWDKRKREEKRVETSTISIVSFEPFIQARSWPTWRRWGENVMLERLLASTTNILSIPRRSGRWKMMGLESGSSRDIWMQDAAPRLWLPVPIRFLLYSVNFSSLSISLPSFRPFYPYVNKVYIFSVTRRSRSDSRYSLTDGKPTWLMWPWWVMIPIEDLTDD